MNTSKIIPHMRMSQYPNYNIMIANEKKKIACILSTCSCDEEAQEFTHCRRSIISSHYYAGMLALQD